MSGAVENTRTRKINQFSIEALIGKGNNKTDKESCLPVKSGDVRHVPNVSRLDDVSGVRFKDLLRSSGTKSCSPILDYHKILRTWNGHSESSLFQPFKVPIGTNMAGNSVLSGHFSPLALNQSMLYSLPRNIAHQSEVWCQARYAQILHNQRYSGELDTFLYYSL